jgi:2-oxo-hept-3-ene-1,7-dioate hydratase
MLSENIIHDLAHRLDAAEKTRVQIPHFSREFRDITIEDAYAVQRAWVAMKLKAGRKIKGRKIGLTSKAMQRSSNISEPDYGVLLDDMFFESGTDIPCDRFIEPRVECELAFVLADTLKGPHCTLFDVLSATAYVVPAVEIIDARIERIDPQTKATRKIFDTISDNAADAGIVLGGRPFKPLDIDIRWVAALCYRNGVVEESGVAAAVLNHPANGVAWLANKLHAHGDALQAGDIILAGSFTAPVFGHRGDTFHVDYGPVGAVTLRFV